MSSEGVFNQIQKKHKHEIPISSLFIRREKLVESRGACSMYCGEVSFWLQKDSNNIT